ncbi:MAG: Crp/Fnr family transcriptional regulator [Bacteroidales bacterium]|nr:Crp/Fnr family transcriptional regulator [Bacteroidales bacterium]
MTKAPEINSCTVGIDKCICFDLLTQEQNELINSNSVDVEFSKGETICKQGTFATHIIYLSEGLVKVHMDGTQGSLILKIIPNEHLIALTALFDGNTVFPYSVSAYVRSKVKLIDISIFKKIINENAKFAYEIINTINSNTIQTFGRFYCLTHKQSYGRLADIILCLSERIYKKQIFELLLTRKELAELSGMTTENVIRMLKKFKDDGLIEMDGKSIKLLNKGLLKKISDYG